MSLKKQFNSNPLKKNFEPTRNKLGIRLHEPTYDYKEIDAVVKTLLSSNLTFGRKTKTFEDSEQISLNELLFNSISFGFLIFVPKETS